MIPLSSKTLMLPPCAGSWRTATASGTPWISSPVTPTLTIWRPSGSLYSLPTWSAICCAPVVPPTVGFHADHFSPWSVPPPGASTSATSPAIAARPIAASAPVRKWKRGAYCEWRAGAPGSVAAPGLALLDDVRVHDVVPERLGREQRIGVIAGLRTGGILGMPCRRGNVV